MFNYSLIVKIMGLLIGTAFGNQAGFFFSNPGGWKKLDRMARAEGPERSRRAPAGASR
jgi:hypothetical protein